MVDNTIHQINYYYRIVIYPMDSVIQPLKNWAQGLTSFYLKLSDQSLIIRYIF